LATNGLFTSALLRIALLFLNFFNISGLISRIPGLFTDTSEHTKRICFYFLLFSFFFTFWFLGPCGRLQNSIGKYPNLWRYPNFLITQCGIDGRRRLRAKNQLDSSSRCDTIPVCDGRSDGRDTRRHVIPRYSVASRGKNPYKAVSTRHGRAWQSPETAQQQVSRHRQLGRSVTPQLLIWSTSRRRPTSSLIISGHSMRSVLSVSPSVSTLSFETSSL